MEEVKKIFGKNVQKYRQLKCWTQAELAEKIDISPTFMMHIEHGTRGVSMETIELLARCFEVPFAALFEEGDKVDDSSAILMSLEVSLKSQVQKTIEVCVQQARIRM